MFIRYLRVGDGSYARAKLLFEGERQGAPGVGFAGASWGAKREASPLILARGSGRALEGNQRRGALARDLATNRPSEIVQISSERMDLRVANRLSCAGAALRGER